MKKTCQGCRENTVMVLIDFGSQPVCNRFSNTPYVDDYFHPLILGQCQNCSLIQLMDLIPVEEIIPRVDWLKYKEPEGHLNSLSDIVSNLKDLPEKPIACGITYKDDSLLKRLKERAFERIWRIEPEQDLGIAQKGVAGETIIPKLTTDSVKNITDKYGCVDVVIARHILEHALDTQDFLSIIWKFLKPGGYVVFEVPDCTKQLEGKDYTMPWEEHILYFVPETLKAIFDHTSFELTKFCHYSYKIEDVQIAIKQKKVASIKKNIQPMPDNFRLSEEYAESFEKHRVRIYSYLKEYVSKVGKVAFYGAGHLSVMLVKSLKIEDFIEFIVDDTELKQGLYLPGTCLKIKSPKLLVKENISLCVLCLSVEYEEIVKKKNHLFIDKGGIFVSAFSMQKNSLFKIASKTT